MTEIELASAVSRKIRENNLSKEDGENILSIFQTHISQKSFVYLPVHSQCYTNATKWIARFDTPLRTLDALHLAVAERNRIPLLTADARLAKSSEKTGVEVPLVS